MKSHDRILTRNIYLLFLTTFFFFFMNRMLAPTFPLYVSHLGGNESMVGFLGGLFAFAAVFQRPFFGRMADNRGRKRVLTIAAITAATGPLLYLPDFGFIYLGLVRIYHALSLAAFIIASQTMLADFTPPENRGTVFSLVGTISGIAMATAPIIGIKISLDVGFPIMFLVAAASGFGVVVTSLFIPEPITAEASAKNETPASVSDILRNKWVMIPSTALFALTMGYGAVTMFLPLYALDIGIANVGIYFTFYSIFTMVGRLVSGKLSDRFGRRAIALPGLLSSGIGSAFLIWLTGYPTLIISASLMGLGFAMTHTVLLALIVDKTSIRERSQSVSMFANAFDLGVSAGSMGLGPVARYSFPLLYAIISAASFAGFGFAYKGLREDSATGFQVEQQMNKRT